MVCREETYLKELARYTHLNLLRAGLVKGIEELRGQRFCPECSIATR
jgi:hypothetical protein